MKHGWMRRRATSTMVAIIAGLALVASACGDDDDDDTSAATDAGAAAATTAPDATTAASAATTGGGTEGTESAETTEAGDEPVAGGTATFLNFAEVPTLDAGKARGSTGGGQVPLVAIYDLLVEVDADGEVTGRMAESVTSDDALVWTITLREGLTFTDGTPFDAAAVKAHWDRILDPATASPSIADAGTMESVEVVDDRTLEVTLVEPMGQWPRFLMRGLGMIPSPTAVAELGDGFASAPVGAGPFSVEEYVRDDRLAMVRNPDYWDAPKPYLDELVFRPIVDDQQRFDTLATGDAELAFYVIYTPGLVRSISDGLDVRIAPNSGGQGMVLNVTQPPLDDERVRQALYHATDLEDLNEKVTSGGAALVDTLFAEDSPFNTPDLLAPAYDLAKAQELVDEYLAEKGGTIDLTILGTETARVQYETQQQQWSQLEGVNVSVDIIETTEFLRRQLAGEFQVAGSALSGVDPEPAMYDFIHTGGRANFGKFSDPEIDAALEAGRVALEVDERAAAYEEFQQLLWTKVPYILTFRLPYATVVGEGVEGFRQIDDGLPDLTGVSLTS